MIVQQNVTGVWRVPQKAVDRFVFRPPFLQSSLLSFLKPFAFHFHLTRDFNFSTSSNAKNAMAAPPPDSSYTPPDNLRAKSPSLNDPMEDLDPQSTRKRPRLDSGSGVSPSLSLDGTSRTASVAPASEMDETSDSGPPASKVTINMKSPVSSHDTLADPQLPDPNLQLQNDTDEAPNVISVSSSPSAPQSPEIEVAEPEDIDQDPATSNWKPLRTLHGQEEPEVIEIQDINRFADTFPKLDQNLRHRENFKDLGDIIEHGDIDEHGRRPPTRVAN